MFELKQEDITRSRSGFLFAYAQIAFNQFRRFANLQQSAEQLEKERDLLREQISRGEFPDVKEMAPLGWRTFTSEWELAAEILECKILAVIASAFFLEAYIFDYGARKESVTFVRKYVDRLDPVAKWVLIPRLAVPPGLDTGTELFERLRKLFRLRNELAHQKGGSDLDTPPEVPPDLAPNHCVVLIHDALQALQTLDPLDDFGAFVLRHISSWIRYTAKDSRFYPLLWEA